MTKSHSPPNRDQAIEALRIVAAFAIVAFHAQLGDYRWWHAGLVVFVFLAAMFAARPSAAPRPIGLILRRLLVPFVFWYALYLAANFALGRPLLLDDNLLTAALAGPSFHLWYLPFAVLVIAVLGQLARLPAQIRSPVAVVAGLGGLIALFAGELWFVHLWELPVPFKQWGHAMPAVLAGVFAGYFIEKRPFVAGLALMMMLTAWQFGFSSLGPAYAAGFAAILVTLLLSRFWPRNLSVQPIADCMFGVYLTHIIALAIAARLVTPGSMAQVVIAFALSLAGVWAARRFVPLSKTVLG